jgi:hypothetical protein
VKGKCKFEICLEKQRQECIDCQRLQSSFQTRTKVTNRNNWDTSLNFPSEHLHEKCINSIKLKFQGEIPHERLLESIVTELKLRVGNSINENSDGQGLQQLFQKGIILTKSSLKERTNLLELENSRVTNRKIPFKMKRKVVVRAKKMRVRMKDIYNQNRFEKPKWKIKLEIQSMQHNLHMKQLTY